MDKIKSQESELSQNVDDVSKPVSKNFPRIFVGLLIAALVITSFFTYKYLMNSSSVISNMPIVTSPENVEGTPIEPSQVVTPNPNSIYNNKLVFTKHVAPVNQQNTTELWMMNSDGTDIEKTPFKNLEFAVKFLGTSKMLYTKSEDLADGGFGDTSIYIYDWETKTSTKFNLPKHPNPKATLYGQINDIRYVAPDYSALVINIMYSVPCPDTHSDGGPCSPDDVPGYAQGDFIFNTKTKELIPFNNQTPGGGYASISVSRWDPANSTIYYIYDTYGTDHKSFRKLNYSTKQTVEIKKLDRSVAMMYPLFKTNEFVVFKERYDDGSTSSLSSLSILNGDTGAETFITETEFADMQAFLTISPNEDFALYERTKDVGKVQTVSSIYRLDLKSKKVTQVTPTSDTVGYQVFGYWLDNDNYVTRSELLSLGDNGYYIYQEDTYAVNVNIQTGKVTKLTDSIISEF